MHTYYKEETRNSDVLTDLKQCRDVRSRLLWRVHSYHVPLRPLNDSCGLCPLSFTPHNTHGSAQRLISIGIVLIEESIDI